MGSSGFPGSAADWVSNYQMGLIQRKCPFAGAVVEVRLLIEGRIGSPLGQYLAVRGGWSEEGMATNGTLFHHEVADLGNVEGEMSPSQRQRSPALSRCKGGDVLALPCIRTGLLAEVNRYTLDLKEV